MHKLPLYFIIALLTISLSACNEKYTYDYLVTHPQFLRNEMTRCQKMDSDTKQQCDIVMDAASKFMAQVTIQQADPEQFGETIMNAEILLTNKKRIWKDAKLTYDTLKAKNASAEELAAARDGLVKAKNDYQEQDMHVKEMLGVVGMGSPT